MISKSKSPRATFHFTVATFDVSCAYAHGAGRHRHEMALEQLMESLLETRERLLAAIPTAAIVLSGQFGQIEDELAELATWQQCSDAGTFAGT